MFEWIKNYIISVVDKEFFILDDDKLQIQKLNDKAIIPVKGSEFAAGYDLHSIETIIIPPLSRAIIKTGLCIKTPDGTYGRIAPRSGLSSKNIDIGGGVIDIDYSGEVKIIFINNNINEFEVTEGMKVAQLICEKVCYPKLKIVEKLQLTKRGSDGFGSTDKKIK